MTTLGDERTVTTRGRSGLVATLAVGLVAACDGVLGINVFPGPSDASVKLDTGRDTKEELKSQEAGSGEDGGCTPGTERCADGGTGVETCTAEHGWARPWPCATGTCSAGACAGETSAARSCQGSGPGLTHCGVRRDGGVDDDSCCTSLEVPGGTYYRTYTNTGDAAVRDEQSPATVSGLRIDKYLVTVGRFRQFVQFFNAADGGAYAPSEGAGKHVYLNGGEGLANSGDPDAGAYELGWVTSDNGSIAPTDANLSSCNAYSTWPAADDSLPMNCVNWCEAFAFCIWDGGFLPSEAEWEYAAAGGDEQREYPWGETPPGTTSLYAIYGEGGNECYYPSGTLMPCAGATNIAPVGTAYEGRARWGQLDMAGEIFEWNLDALEDYVNSCLDCAYVTPMTQRINRGGNMSDSMSAFLPGSGRFSLNYLQRGSRGVGFRCARAP